MEKNYTISRFSLLWLSTVTNFCVFEMTLRAPLVSATRFCTYQRIFFIEENCWSRWRWYSRWKLNFYPPYCYSMIPRRVAKHWYNNDIRVRITVKLTLCVFLVVTRGSKNKREKDSQTVQRGFEISFVKILSPSTSTRGINCSARFFSVVSL